MKEKTKNVILETIDSVFHGSSIIFRFIILWLVVSLLQVSQASTFAVVLVLTLGVFYALHPVWNNVKRVWRY